ncbi:MAG TPA: DNA polymerase III subunit alpha [Thermomicrobiales bacterium]|nr:DNA polymerase III subunit alpha [Thermomicrobiales bacterium]
MYVELHMHSAFSFLDGASLPGDLVERGAELGYAALALTDHDGLHGAMEFAQAARGAGIQPITGAELTMADGSHLTLLAETQAGYANLSRLISHSHLTSPRLAPRLDWDVLREHVEGLILLTGCRNGALIRLVDTGQLDAARRLLNEYRAVFGPEDVFVELQHNLAHGDVARIARLVHLADEAGLGYVATGNVHYATRDRHRLQDVLVAIANRTTLDASHQLRRPNSEFFLQPHAIVARRFLRYPEALANTLRIAERCASFNLTRDLHYRFPEYAGDEEGWDEGRGTRDEEERGVEPGVWDVEGGEPSRSAAISLSCHSEAAAEESLPCRCERTRERSLAAARDDKIPGSVVNPARLTSNTHNPNNSRPPSLVPRPQPFIPSSPDSILARDCHALLVERYGDDPAARERLDHELALVRKHGLAGFFLVYRDIMRLAREVAVEVRGNGPRANNALPPGRGRGSSVSSIICYLIGLSHIDPLRHNLYIGRFLNEEMASVPDIDLDFPREIRERLIARIYEVYGNDRAALVCAFPTYHIRSAIRDIGKVLGLPATDLDRLAKLSERASADHLAEEMERLPEFQSRRDAPLWRELIDLSTQIARLPRHVTQHSGGMVISSQPLVELVPVQPAAMEGRYVCQWDKDSCDDARFIKIDFLALGMLSLVEECLELIVETGKGQVDLSRIDFEDSEVYDMICRGDTIGVFQIESRAQIQSLLRTQPRNLEDLIVQVSIVRPGPIIGGAVNPYIRARQQLRREGRVTATYDHPLLEPVLRETYGGILYQEQVLEVAVALAGFSAGQADSLRRAMSRKRSLAAMDRLWDQFRDGAAGKGVDETIALRVFEKLLGFAAYGFPKSHAAAFAVLAYQSCWLRFYYPAEFTCALFNNQPMGFYPPHAFANDAKRHGVSILLPDVNRSAGPCAVEGQAVRIGLGHVDGLSEEIARAVVAERQRGGPYQSLIDLARRSRLRREAVEHLIIVGACDSFGLRRRELLWQLGLFLPDRRVGPVKQPAAWQLALDLPTGQDMVALAGMTDWERMIADYDILGLSPHHHPLALLRPALPQPLVRAADLERGRDGGLVRLAGLVVCRQRPATAKGLMFMLLEDETGLANVIVHQPVYEEHRAVVRGYPFLIVTGRLQLRDGTVNIIAQDVVAIDRPHASGPQVTEPIAALLSQAGRLGELSGDISDEQLTELRLAAPASHDFH